MHNLSYIKSQNNMKNDHRGIRAPDPANPCSEKMTSQPTFFAACTPPKCNQFTLAFYFFLIQTHISTCFSKMKACMGVIYFLVFFRKHDHITSVQIFAQQRGRIHNDMQKNATFWVKPLSCLTLWQCGVFSFSKVCVFLPMVLTFIMFFITTLCLYDFCKTVSVTKYTPCQEIIWFSCTRCHNIFTGFYV